MCVCVVCVLSGLADWLTGLTSSGFVFFFSLLVLPAERWSTKQVPALQERGVPGKVLLRYILLSTLLFFEHILSPG